MGIKDKTVITIDRVRGRNLLKILREVRCRHGNGWIARRGKESGETDTRKLETSVRKDEVAGRSRRNS